MMDKIMDDSVMRGKLNKRRIKPIGQTRITYNCKANDNHFILIVEDGKLDEIWFGECLKKSWTVIGAEDLITGLKQAGLVIDRGKE